MKKCIKMFVALVAIGGFFSCEPTEDRESLPAQKLSKSEINIQVTQAPQNTNMVTMENLTDGIIPYWSYRDGTGNELGHSNENKLDVMLPFAGTYTVQFTAFNQAGAVEAEPVTVVVAQNNEELFSAPEWGMLTNGAAGKTWELDMSSPIGWAGLDFPYNTSGSDYWNWFPDYAGNTWVMPSKDWGEMTFNLDGGYNVSVTQTALATDTQTTKTGSFGFNVEGHTLNFNGGVEMLFGGDYYPDASNWTSVHVVELTETSMRLAVIRDQSRSGEGVCKIVFHFKPKE